MDPIDFVQKRKADIFAIEKEIFENAKKLSKQPFQRLPRFLRRRAASHNTRRLPARFRSITEKSGRGSHGKKSLRFKSKSHLLETYSWHSKRCKMGIKFGLRLPISNNEKTFKHCVSEAKDGCFVHDMSYWRVVVDGDTLPVNNFGDWNYNRDSTSTHQISCTIESSSVFRLCHPSVETGEIHSNMHACLLLIGSKSHDIVKSSPVFSNTYIFRNAQFNCVIIIVRRETSFNVWKALVHNGCRVGAYEELLKVSIEHEVPIFPHDFPAIPALEAVESELIMEIQNSKDHKPKSKIDHIYNTKLLSSIVKYKQMLSEPMEIVLFTILGKGRPTIYSSIHDTENNCVGFLTRVDFSEIRGKVIAIGCIKKGTFMGSQLTCLSINGKSYSLQMIHGIL